jgi:hypothetical protein
MFLAGNFFSQFEIDTGFVVLHCMRMVYFPGTRSDQRFDFGERELVMQAIAYD